MLNDTLLFIISFVTMVGIRLFIWLIPEKDIKIFGRVIHHFWFGTVFVVLAYLISYRNILATIIMLGIGLSLMGDELMFMLLGGGHDREYWGLVSIIGAILSLIVIFYFRTKLLQLI